MEGPAERGEGPLPAGAGTVTFDFYLQDVTNFGAIQLTLRHARPDGSDPGIFLISTQNGNPLFDSLAVVHNAEAFPSVFPV
ncbi:MAG TPA: hypothetical protein VM223_19805, partial [Planctomycetota bacterium]|nr:hypothetical protein [Planctomycetota bacterium]